MNVRMVSFYLITLLILFSLDALFFFVFLSAPKKIGWKKIGEKKKKKIGEKKSKTTKTSASTKQKQLNKISIISVIHPNVYWWTTCCSTFRKCLTIGSPASNCRYVPLCEFAKLLSPFFIHSINPIFFFFSSIPFLIFFLFSSLYFTLCPFLQRISHYPNKFKKIKLFMFWFQDARSYPDTHILGYGWCEWLFGRHVRIPHFEDMPLLYYFRISDVCKSNVQEKGKLFVYLSVCLSVSVWLHSILMLYIRLLYLCFQYMIICGLDFFVGILYFTELLAISKVFLILFFPKLFYSALCNSTCTFFHTSQHLN